MSEVFAHKTGVMFAMTSAIARGYTHHAHGIVKPESATKLVERFKVMYFTDMTPVQRTRAKKAGRAGARFFIHPDYQEYGFRWWLLLTEGEHPARTREKIFDHTGKLHRLRVFDQFEAVRLPTDGAAPTWTWRLQEPYFADQVAMLRETIRRRGAGTAGELEAQIAAIHRFPGFRGIRNDVRELRKLIAAEWKRTRSAGTTAPLPLLPQGYVRAKTFRTVPLELVARRIMAGHPPIADEWRYKGNSQSAAYPPPGIQDAPTKSVSGR